MKRLCSRRAEYGLNITPDRYRPAGVRLLRTSDIGVEGSLRGSGGVYLDPADVPHELLLRDGDVLFSRSGTIGRALLFDREQHGGATFAGFLVRFRLREDVDPRAIRYWSESAPFAGTVDSEAIQSTISNFNADRYANLQVPRFLAEHSAAIADYLDAQTARIDVVVARRADQLRVLGQIMQSAVHEVMPVPEQIQGGRIKMVVSTAAGGTPSTDNRLLWGNEGDVPWVTIADMSSGGWVRSTAKHVSTAGISSARLPVGRPGTVLLAMYASVGVSAFLGVEATWNQAILALVPIPGRADPRFLRYWLERLREYWPLVIKSNTQDNLSAELVRGAPFPLLPIEDQVAAANRLDRVSERVVGHAGLLSRQIELLLERRRALITAAVSGDLEILRVPA